MLRRDLIKNKIYGSIFIILGALTIPIEWDATFFLFTLMLGVLIFDKNSQDTHSGGSGCGCCGTVFSGYFFKQLKQKKLKKILLIATGALTNSTTSQQGESIPGIAHAISIEI